MPISPVSGSPTPQSLPTPSGDAGTSPSSNNAFGFLTVANAGPGLNQAGEIDGGDASLLEVTLKDQSTSATARAAQLQTLASRMQASANALASSYSQMQALSVANVKLQGDLQNANKQLTTDNKQLTTDNKQLTTDNNTLTAAKNQLVIDQGAGAPASTLNADQAVVDADQATVDADQASVATDQANVTADQANIDGINKQIKANTDEINFLQAGIPAIVAEITATAAALKKVQQINGANSRIVSAQLSGIFKAIDKFDAQIQAQGIDQWRQDQNINDARTKQLQAFATQLANELSVPAGEISSAAVQSSRARVKIPI